MIWTKTKISEFLFERKGRYKPNDKEIQGLQRIEKIDFSGNIHIGDKSSNTNMILVKRGDLVISGINVAKGAMAIYAEDNDVVATIHYSSYTFDKTMINVDYFKRFLKSPEFIRLLNEKVKGGIKTEIKPKHILPLEINLPDIETQNSIVSNFEKIEDDIIKLDSEVDCQQSLLTKLKQSILQEAIEGKLTYKWRKENQDIEPASILLDKIQKEKEQLIKEKKLKKPQSIKNIKTLRDIDIPSNWKWAKGDEIFFTTKLAGFEYTEHITLEDRGEVPVIRAQNVRPFNIKKDNLKYIDMETSLKLHRCALTKPSLLVTFIGAGIGDVALFNEKKRWHLAPNVAKQELFEGCEDLISLKFINHYMMSDIGKQELFKHIKATAQPSLSMGTIRDIDYPIPPIEEQKQIVNKIEKLFAICDELEEQINSSKQNTQTLMQAVLKEAFEN